ncbi:hypothetical protein Tsubulata_002359 [Turnera subulata]|uniref:Rab3GAP catalytic subunit conserved domain-containing protein n=1 Tax=Turnera subulata TaxID=218843 RepID=A0A9Q0JKT1_9ROSI|nr:hypothetical protein Tsubulata_002359 [Turnera subulata]
MESPSSSSSSSSSFVSKARTAFHSAAAKAERVLTDIKSDFKSDRSEDSDKWSPREPVKHFEAESLNNESESKSNNEGRHLRWRPSNIGTKQEWQDRFKNIRIGKRGAESPTEKTENPAMAIAFYDENAYILYMKNDAEAKSAKVSSIIERLDATNPDSMPPSKVMKQLAAAVEAGKNYNSVKDLLMSTGGSSPRRERAGLTLSAVKSLVLRERDDKILTSELGEDEKVLLLIRLLFDTEANFLKRNVGSGAESLSLPRDIHGAPPDSFVARLSEVIGNFKTIRKMALLWCIVVVELRRIWSEELHIPGIPVDQIPDLNSCLLYQQLQVINCCVSRKRRHILATESLESVMKEASSCSEESAVSRGTSTSNTILYAKINSGELVLRLGADRLAPDLKMLETGEPVYFPVTQEGPLLTEDVIKETEEFVLRTRSVGAGCSQLLSDMQAFKAANPGCILEDFVRWHSPPDWSETEPKNEAIEFSVGSDSARGHLSSRMQKEGYCFY